MKALLFAPLILVGVLAGDLSKLNCPTNFDVTAANVTTSA
jgi:hypothetical protein